MRVINGMSFLEPVCAALGIDPANQLVLIDAMHMAEKNVPTFPPSCGALIHQIGTEWMPAKSN